MAEAVEDHEGGFLGLPQQGGGREKGSVGWCRVRCKTQGQERSLSVDVARILPPPYTTYNTFTAHTHNAHNTHTKYIHSIYIQHTHALTTHTTHTYTHSTHTQNEREEVHSFPELSMNSRQHPRPLVMACSYTSANASRFPRLHSQFALDAELFIIWEFFLLVLAPWVLFPLSTPVLQPSGPTRSLPSASPPSFSPGTILQPRRPSGIPSDLQPSAVWTRLPLPAGWHLRLCGTN